MLETLNFAKITSLALADAVNPCEMAVLIMVLFAILIQNPDKKRKALYAGLAFSFAIFLGYLFYGIVLVQLFNSFALFLKANSLYIYRGLAILAMILGALNIKDFFMYHPGGLATEMPIFMRPKVKRIIQKITSPGGAFIIGFIVTLFLLPCTMGPYIIASGLLAELGVLGALPWLMYYNLVFILPMIIITLIVYFGFSRVEDVSGWKDRNIRWLHLIAGLLLFAGGVALLAGWI